MQAETAAAPADTLSIRLLTSDQELVAVGRAGDRSAMSDSRTGSRSVSPGTTQDLRGSHTLSAASTRQASAEASSSSARFSWRLPPFHLFQRPPSFQIAASSGDLSSRKLPGNPAAPRQLDLTGGALSDTLATNAASSATFAHHLHNSRSTVLPAERVPQTSESSSYDDSSLGTAELSSSLSAASYGTPAAAEAGRSIDSGSLSDDERTGPCGHGVPSPRSQGTLHTTDADAELAVQEEPTGDADEVCDVGVGAAAGSGGEGAGGSALPGMLSQLSSVTASAAAPGETASGRVVWWENPLGGNSASMQSEGPAGSTADGTAAKAAAPPDAAQSSPSASQPAQERTAGGTHHSTARYSTARSTGPARPPLPPAGVPAAPVADAAGQPQANLDSLLRTSMMHSSQLFGSGREQCGLQQPSAQLSTQDPVSALDMRMQHHEPVSSAFPVEDSSMFHRSGVVRTSGVPPAVPAGAPASIPTGNPSGCTLELPQQRGGVTAVTGDITTGFTDPLQAIDVEMQHFAPTDELSQCGEADTSGALSGQIALQAAPSARLHTPAAPEPRVCSLEDDDSLPLPPLMVVERSERRAPARSGRITQFQAKRRLGAAGRGSRAATARANSKAAAAEKAPKGRRGAQAAPPGTAAAPPGADQVPSESPELFASASSMLSAELEPSGGTPRSLPAEASMAAPPEQLPAAVGVVLGAAEVRAPASQQAGGALSSQESSGASGQLGDLTGDLMHPSCTYSLSVANGSLASLGGGTSSLTGRSSGGVPGLEPGTPPRREREVPGSRHALTQGISPLDLPRDGQPSLRERFATAATESDGSDIAAGRASFSGLAVARDEELPPTPSMPGADSRALTLDLDNSIAESSASVPWPAAAQRAPPPVGSGQPTLRERLGNKAAQPAHPGPGPGARAVEESPYSSFSFETDLESENTNTWWSSIIAAGRDQDSAARV